MRLFHGRMDLPCARVGVLMVVLSALLLFAPSSTLAAGDYYFQDNYIGGPEYGIFPISSQGPFTSPDAIGEACKSYYLRRAGGDTCSAIRVTLDPPRGPGWACQFNVAPDPMRNGWLITDVYDGDGGTREIGLIRFQCENGQRLGDDDNLLSCTTYVNVTNAGGPPSFGLSTNTYGYDALDRLTGVVTPG